MSFKPDSAPPFALAGFGVMTARGRDAAAFLQAQTMNDVGRLETGHWHWNGWLTPKGRVVALFALLRTGDDEFALVLPDHPADALREALQRYVFRSRVALAADGMWRVAGGSPVAGCTGAVAARADGGWALDFGGDGGPRTLRLLPADCEVATPNPATDAAWRAFDIAHGLPRLGPDQVAAWTPQMLSLERLGAFSLKKGCYPGQEIVARTHYLGQARRELARLRGHDLDEGAAVSDGERDAGKVVCVTADGSEALAVLAADAGERLETAGRPITRTPPREGLRRVT